MMQNILICVAFNMTKFEGPYNVWVYINTKHYIQHDSTINSTIIECLSCFISQLLLQLSCFKCSVFCNIYASVFKHTIKDCAWMILHIAINSQGTTTTILVSDKLYIVIVIVIKALYTYCIRLTLCPTYIIRITRLHDSSYIRTATHSINPPFKCKANFHN